jgi:hypothetical protein
MCIGSKRARVVYRKNEIDERDNDSLECHADHHAIAGMVAFL